MELNNIPKTGNWNDVSSRINDNFSKVNYSITRLDNIEQNRKGYFVDDAELKAAYPSPKVGWYAYVGSTNTIWKASGSNWVDTGEAIPSDVDLSGYAKNNDLPSFTNSIADGRFSDGLDKWFFGSNLKDLSVENNILTFTGQGNISAGGINWLRQHSSIGTIPENHIIYTSAKVKGISGNKYFYIGASYNGTRYDLSDSFRRYSFLGHSPNTSPQYATFGAYGTIQMTDVICINLTLLFGAGNEPNKEQMDYIIDSVGWFEGVKYLSSELIKLLLIPSSSYITKDELEPYITKDELEPYITEDELEPYAKSGGSTRSIKDLEINLINILKNGDFSNGLTDWTLNTDITNASTNDNILTFTGTGSVSSSSKWLTQVINLPENTVLYVSALAKKGNSNAEYFYIGNTYDYQRYALTDTFERYSYCGTRPDTVPIKPTFGAYGTVNMKEPLCINLTELFGEGNEPTKEQMDSMLKDIGWFKEEYFMNKEILKIATSSKTSQNMGVINIASIDKPIVFDLLSRKINFTSKISLRYMGVSYSINMPVDFILDFGTQSNVKTICFDISKLENVVNLGLSQSCFPVYSQSELITDSNHLVIATIPYNSSRNNIMPHAIFDYTTDYEENRTAVLASPFESHIPEVSSLKTGDTNAIVFSDEYAQVDKFIQFWDDLTIRANRIRPYVHKCWIDGTPYDDTRKCLSTLPTTGTHNVRNDMNQYELLMYKFVPDTFDGYETSSDVFKPVRRKILIIAGVHGGGYAGGDHWESPVAWYYVMKKLVEEFYVSDQFVNIRNQFEIHIIPAANPWGLNNQRRQNGANLDINRDFVNFASNEAQYIKPLLELGEYDLVIDSHCLGGTVLPASDAQYFFMTSDDRLRQLGRQILNYMRARYDVPVSGSRIISTETIIGYYMSLGYREYLILEMYANAAQEWGDTVGDIHGEEAVRRCVIFCQNVLSIMCNYIARINR